MDWENVAADKNLIQTTHYTEGREAIRFIVLHHNAGTLSAEEAFSVWQNRPASAHYQVDIDGNISQHVWDTNTAWHAGDWWVNQNSIGIEHANDAYGPWTISEKTLDAGAHLVAALCKYYGLGRPQWLVNVFPHSHFSPTACPGEIAGSQNDRYMRRAQYWYDFMTGAIAPTPAERAATVQLYTANNTPAQRWAIEWIDETWFRLRNLACGLYLDVSGAGTTSGTRVQAYTANSSVAQKWRFQELQTDAYAPKFVTPVEIIPATNESLRLDVNGQGEADGTIIQVYEANQTPAQLFQINDRGDGTLSIINIKSDKAIDVVGGGL